MYEVSSPIKEIMMHGGELIASYKESLLDINGNPDLAARGSVTYVGSGYYLVFATDPSKPTEQPPEYVACLYDFNFSQEPMLSFSSTMYFPKAGGFDASYWLKFVNAARVEYSVARSVNKICSQAWSRIGINPKGGGWPVAPTIGSMVGAQLSTGVMMSRIIEETDSLLYHINIMQIARGESVYSFAGTFADCGVTLSEEKLQPTLRILIPAPCSGYSKAIEVVSGIGTFEVQGNINNEVSKDLAKLLIVLKEVRKLVEIQYA